MRRVFIIVIFILFCGGLLYSTSPKHKQFDLLAPQDWSHLQGAEPAINGINIKPVGRVLTHRDTSTAQPNPSVNVRGPHLKVTGDFVVETKISDAQNGAQLQLYGQVPIIYDEWRQERGSIRLDVTNSLITVQIWDGSSPSSIDKRDFKTRVSDEQNVALVHEGGQIVIKSEGKVLGDIPDHNIFDQGTVWFGANANLGTAGWTLKSLTAKTIGKGQLELIPPPDVVAQHDQPDALRNLASANKRNLPIGAAISIYPLFTDDQYRKIALGQFSMMTIENSLKPQFIHPQKDLYAYKDADSLVEVASKNKIQIHGHSLVMGKANPQWMQNTPEHERNQVMKDHISNVVGHFKGKMTTWDVVNEPLSEDDIDYTNGRMGIRKQIWSDAMGEQYIDTAFIATKQADPNAKLYLNDFGLEKDGKRWDALVALVARLQARGVPIDGVGFESHVYHEPDLIDPAVLQRHIQILASMGVSSRISEIDVLGDDKEVQAKQYADVLSVCLSEPTCTSYTTWGISDLYGSTNLSDRYPVKFGKSLLWDEDYIPKPALSSLQQTLK